MLVMLAALLALTALAAACSDDPNDSDTAKATTDEDRANAEAGAMIAALNVLDGAELHHINLALVGDDPAIDPAWLGAVRNSRTAVGAIAWPEDLHELVDAYHASSATFEAALADDDVAAAAEIVGQTHADFHALSVAGWDQLASIAGTTASGHGNDHGDSADEEDSHE